MPPRSKVVPSRSVGECDLDEVVVQYRPGAHVGLALRRRGIRVRSVRGELAPPDGRRPNDTFTQLLADAGDGGELSSIVEHYHACAVRDAAWLRVPRMKHALRLRVLSQRLDVHERRVQEIVAGR